MPLQSTGSISLADVAEEFGGTTPHSLSEYYNAASGIPSSGEISLSDFYGASAAFLVAIAFNVTNGANVRALATTAGWDQSEALLVRVNSGVAVRNTSGWAMTVQGSFPNGLRIENNGTIIGEGGVGGTGGGAFATTVATLNGTAGGAGGNALLVETACVIENNGTIASGGGGGGGGGGGYGILFGKRAWCGAGGGGGGAAFGAGGSRGINAVDPDVVAFNNTSSAGAAGTLTTGGAGGVTGGIIASYTPPGGSSSSILFTSGNPGGNGGDAGASGSAGSALPSGGGVGESYLGNGGAGGATGIAIRGINRVTFLPQGTISGNTENN
jgi:hypothetical protein